MWPRTILTTPIVGRDVHRQSNAITSQNSDTPFTLVVLPHCTQVTMEHLTREFNNGNVEGTTRTVFQLYFKCCSFTSSWLNVSIVSLLFRHQYIQAFRPLSPEYPGTNSTISIVFKTTESKDIGLFRSTGGMQLPRLYMLHFRISAASFLQF